MASTKQRNDLYRRLKLVDSFIISVPTAAMREFEAEGLIRIINISAFDWQPSYRIERTFAA